MSSQLNIDLVLLCRSKWNDSWNWCLDRSVDWL